MSKTKHVSSRSKKAGLPPGELIHVGEVKSCETIVTAFIYDQNGVEERALSNPSELSPLCHSEKLIWINIDGLSNIEWIQKAGELFKLHPLALEDVLNSQQRPKREEFDDYLFVVIKSLEVKLTEASPKSKFDRIEEEQISLFIGERYLLTFQEKVGDALAAVRDRLLHPDSRLRHFGVDFLAYSCIDTIIDKYFSVLEVVGDDVEKLETEIVSSVQNHSLNDLYAIKREVLSMRRIIWPTRELIAGLERGQTRIIQHNTLPFFRDVYSHCLEAVEMLEMQRETLSGLLDVYLSSISNRLNNVMRVLTVLTTIFMPLTVITGIYGMNFEHMPELHWKYGYLYVLGLMVAISVAMLSIFKKQKWL